MKSEISNKAVGAWAGGCLLLALPFVLALGCVGLGVLGRAWHWMLGGF